MLSFSRSVSSLRLPLVSGTSPTLSPGLLAWVWASVPSYIARGQASWSIGGQRGRLRCSRPRTFPFGRIGSFSMKGASRGEPGTGVICRWTPSLSPGYKYHIGCCVNHFRGQSCSGHNTQQVWGLLWGVRTSAGLVLVSLLSFLNPHPSSSLPFCLLLGPFLHLSSQAPGASQVPLSRGHIGSLLDLPWPRPG